MKILLPVILLACSFAEAATLECKSLVNLNVVAESNAITTLNEKIVVNKTEQVIAYVTETKPSYFVVEAFLPSLEMRIYAEGAIANENDELKTSAWARDIMIDVVCKKIN